MFLQIFSEYRVLLNFKIRHFGQTFVSSEQTDQNCDVTGKESKGGRLLKLAAGVGCCFHLILGTWKRVHIMSHSEIDTFRLARWRRPEKTSGKMSCSKTFFLVISVYTKNVLNARVHV